MVGNFTINGLYREELTPELYDLISEIKGRYNINRKLVVTIEDSKYDQPNAFSEYYLDFDKLIFTRGVFKTFNLKTESDEIKAIIAHEFSHISHKDFTTGIKIIIAGMFAVLTVFYSVKMILFQSDPISGIISIITLLIIGEIYFWWRRRTELRSDSDAVKITQNFDAQIRLRNKMEARSIEIKNTIKFYKHPGSYLKRLFFWIFLGDHPSNKIRVNNLEKLKTNFMKSK